MFILSLIGLLIGLDTIKQPRRLISVGGLVTYIFLCYLGSKHRRQVLTYSAYHFFTAFICKSTQFDNRMLDVGFRPLLSFNLFLLHAKSLYLVHI